MPLTNSLSVKKVWQTAWISSDYKKKVLIGLTLISVALYTLPHFFKIIESRDGILLNDWVLNKLPACNVSIPIFVILWSMALLLFARLSKDPEIFIIFLWSYLFLLLSRFITMSLIPLDPPVGLIPLADPLSNSFYGPKFITKDLFYSGHTGSLFLIFLCLKRRSDKIIALFATIFIGILLLIQHVHYTIDIIFAPIIIYFLWLAAKKIVNFKL